MQEEVESRTVNLAISTTKLSMRTIVHAGMMYLRHRKLVKDLKKNEVPSGKQSVQELIGQKQGGQITDTPGSAGNKGPFTTHIHHV